MTFFVAILTVSLIPFLSGCGKDTGQTEVTTPSVEARIKQIEDNRDMPQHLKAVAIQQIRANEARGTAAGASQLTQEKKMK